MLWKNDWQTAKTNLIKWWDCKGPALSIVSPRNKPLLDLPKPQTPADIEAVWADPEYRRAKGEYNMANTCCFAEAFPLMDANVGPGSVATFLGSRPHFAPETVWYEPCISDPDTYGPIHFDPANYWFQRHVAILKECTAHAAGRYITMLPDMIENLDTLAAMRDTQVLLMDMIERPAWVAKKVDEINEAYFQSFDLLFDIVKADGGNAFCFNLWGPGKTAKLQCDISCMIAPAMFNELCVPALRRQCQWLDYSMYHLDGEDALQHLDSLLAIGELDAIEWTPIGASGKVAGMPTGGSPAFYDLYKRILKAGKGVQAVGVAPDEVIPMLDAVGPAGMFLMVWANDQATAEKLYEKTRQYY